MSVAYAGSRGETRLVTPLVAMAAFGVLRCATVLLFSIGMGALTATAVANVLAARQAPAWGSALAAFGFEVALASLLSASASSSLMPRRAARLRRDDPVATPTASLDVPLLGLAAVAAFQVPALLNWWTADAALLREAGIGVHRDPLGLDAIPRAIVHALPAIGLVAAATFIATSVASVLAPRRELARVLAAAVALQVGLVILVYLGAQGVEDIGRAVIHAMRGAPDAGVPEAMAWFARHDDLAGVMIVRLGMLCAAYAAMLAFVAVVPRQRQQSVGDAAPPLAPPPPAATAVPPISTASAAFGDSHYLLQARSGVLALMAGRRFTDYSIDTVPPRVAWRSSFSWTTGLTRLEPSGPELFRIVAAERHGLVRRAYEVIEASSGSPIGRMVPDGEDWGFFDAQHQPVAKAIQAHASFERLQYTVKIAERDVCRLTWTMVLGAVRTEVEIEFLVDGDQFDRAFPMALAPIVADAARRARRA